MCMWCRKWYIELLSASCFHKDDGLGHGNIYLGNIMVALELELPELVACYVNKTGLIQEEGKPTG